MVVLPSRCVGVVRVGPLGFEPRTRGLRVRYSGRTELEARTAQSQLLELPLSELDDDESELESEQ